MGNFQEASDLENTVGISARRFEESPFIERTQHPDMVRGVYAGRYFAISLNEDYIEKYWLNRIANQRNRDEYSSFMNVVKESWEEATGRKFELKK